MTDIGDIFSKAADLEHGATLADPVGPKEGE